MTNTNRDPLWINCRLEQPLDNELISQINGPSFGQTLPSQLFRRFKVLIHETSLAAKYEIGNCIKSFFFSFIYTKYLQHGKILQFRIRVFDGKLFEFP